MIIISPLQATNLYTSLYVCLDATLTWLRRLAIGSLPLEYAFLVIFLISTNTSERIKKAKEEIDRQFGNLVAVELAYLICLTPEFVHYVAGRPDQGLLQSWNSDWI